jgi:hypothetical protein
MMSTLFFGYDVKSAAVLGLYPEYYVSLFTYQSNSHSFLAGTNHLGGIQTSHLLGTVTLHRPLNGSIPRLVNRSLYCSAQIKLPRQSSSVSQSRTSHIRQGFSAVQAVCCYENEVINQQRKGEKQCQIGMNRNIPQLRNDFSVIYCW